MQPSGVNFWTFFSLCVRETFKTVWDKADFGATMAGIAIPVVIHFVPAWEHALNSIAWEIPLACLASIGLTRLLMSPFLVYRKRDNDAHTKERQLLEEIQTRQKSIDDQARQIAERDVKISDLEKPKRSPAEEHEYQHAKDVVSKANPKARTVLQFLHRHGEQIFGVYNPVQLPDGINADEMRSILQTLAKEGLVSRRDINEPRNPHSVYDIATSMKALLDDLLYET